MKYRDTFTAFTPYLTLRGQRGERVSGIKALRGVRGELKGNGVTRSFMVVIISKYYCSDETKEDEGWPGHVESMAKIKCLQNFHREP
jgi:hypothetical protein